MSFFLLGPIPIFLADNRYANAGFLELIVGADTAFAPSIYIKNDTMMITNVTCFNLKKGTFIELSSLSVNHADWPMPVHIKNSIISR